MSFLETVLSIVEHLPKPIGREASRLGVNYFAASTPARPRAFSLWSAEPKPPGDASGPITDYTSWPSLVDRRWNGRHLPPADPAYVSALPKDEPPNAASQTVGQITELFARRGRMKTSRSSLLFMFFAQWFTDSVLRIDGTDRRKNTSNHDIDLCQIYGLSEETTRLLRTLSEDASERGKLRSQRIGPKNEEHLDYLCERNGGGGFKVKDRYRALPYADKLDAIVGEFPVERRAKLYATGLERGNSSVGYVAISTIFMREHNRICDELRERYPTFDDERLFQTARMINIVLLLKLIVEDYINHILGKKLFVLDHSFAEKEHWYRANWIALEFDLLYRWHALVPDAIRVNGSDVLPSEFRTNNALLEELGVAALITTASTQAAGKIGLGNTPGFLLGAEYQSLRMGRDFRLRTYNEYRRQFRLDPLDRYDQLTSDAELRAKLEALYGPIENLEYLVGLFAEEATGESLFGELLNRMVAYDAFTQIFSNPLLSSNVYGEATFTPEGLAIIEGTRSFQDLVDRNLSAGSHATASLGLVQPG